MSAPSPSADRNLLFGLLALQMDFLSRDQLLEAMLAWMLDKQTPLGEILCRRGVLAEDDRADVERLVDKHIRRHGGDPRASLAAVRIDPDVRASLAALDDADVQASLSPPTKVSVADSIPLAAPPFAEPVPMPFNGVRYSKLRPHARGGLGEVFVARDEELHREVALKEIQDRFADHADSRSRFVREAEITGHLEHPGVVPVYGLGAYPDGRPFYAMRFIHGQSLHEAIHLFHQAGPSRRDVGERRLALRELLTRFVAVCNAVAYAHSRGVIHRDLKPANVMLGEYGETLVVDWGLARLIAQDDPYATTSGVPVRLSAGSGTAPTELGQAVGTPAYMPPEQANGKLDQLGPASDVFALGAILYHVLTGEPPYQGTHAQQVLDQAKRGQVAPARQQRADVPRPLEAVCARAMAASPRERYAEARALAEEVRRWLADEPVQAYREPLQDQVRRWGRRHRTLVSVGVALLLAGVVALGVGLWRVNAEREETAKQRDRAVEAEEQAQANLKLARQAIDECYNVAYKDPLFQGPRMEKARNLLLRKTLRFYKNFRVQRPADRDLQHEEANQWFRVGNIERVLQLTEDAKEAYKRARELYEALVQAHPDLPAYQNDLAGAHNNLGGLLSVLGQREEALKEYQLARLLQQKLVQALPDLSEYEQALARTHSNLGLLLSALGKGEEALNEYQKARLLQEKLVQNHPDGPEYQKDLAATHTNLGNLLSDLRKREKALKEYRHARELQEKLVQTHPDVPEYQKDLATTHNSQGILLYVLAKHEEALKEFQEAASLQQKLVHAHPDVPEYQKDLALTHNNLGARLAAAGKGEEALKEYQKARLLQEKLVQTHPDVPEYQKDLAGTHNNIGNLLLSSLGKGEQALKEYQHACTLLQKLVQAYPEVPAYQQYLAAAHANLGTLLSDLRKGEEALKEYRLARELEEKLVQAHPDIPEYQSSLSDIHDSLGILLPKLGKHEEALVEYEQARLLQQKLVQAHPDFPEYGIRLAGTCCNMGNLLRVSDKIQESLSYYAQAIDLLQPIFLRVPDHPTTRLFLRNSHWGRARALVGLGRHRDAIADWDQAIRLDTGAARTFFRLQRADSLARAGDYRRAAAEAEELAAAKGLSAGDLYNFACIHALNAVAADKDASQPLPQREKRAGQYARAAVELLQRTAKAGYFRDPKTVEHMDKDDDLAGLRDREDYRAFRKTLATKPVAPR